MSFNQNAIKTLQTNYDTFKACYGSEENAKRMLDISIAIASDKKFEKCTQTSIAKAIMDAVRLGLDTTPGVDHVWLVPYKDNVQLQISARGWIQMLYRDSAKWLIKTEPIYKCDEYEHVITETGEKFTLRPDLEGREVDNKQWIWDNMVGIFVQGTDSSNSKITKVISKKAIEKLRLSSPGQIYTNNWTKQEVAARIAKKLPVDIWEKWYEEMAITKAIKLFAKRLPVGSKDVHLAIKTDDLYEAGIDTVYNEKTNQLMEAKHFTEETEKAVKSLNLTADNIDGYAVITKVAQDRGDILLKLGFINDNGTYRMLRKSPEINESSKVNTQVQTTIDVEVNTENNIETKLSLAEIRQRVKALGLKTSPIIDGRGTKIVKVFPDSAKVFDCKEELNSLGFVYDKPEGAQYGDTYIVVAGMSDSDESKAKVITNVADMTEKLKVLGFTPEYVKFEGRDYAKVIHEDAYNKRTDLAKLGFKWKDLDGWTCWNIEVVGFEKETAVPVQKQEKLSELEIELANNFINYKTNTSLKQDEVYLEVVNLDKADTEAMQFIVSIGFAEFKGVYYKNITLLNKGGV